MGTGCMTFATYVKCLQQAFNNLELLSDPMKEDQKVNHFLNGISDHSLNMAKAIIMAWEDLNMNWDAAQTYVSTMLVQMVQTKSARHGGGSSGDGKGGE